MKKDWIIALVDDDPAQRCFLGDALMSAGYECLLCHNGNAALENAGQCHLMLLDIRLPDIKGLEVFQILREKYPSLPIILITAFIDVRDAISVVKEGAVDYMEKPIDLDRLFSAVEAALELQESDRTENDAFDLPAGTVVKSKVMRQVYEDASRFANSSTTILLLGESGTGKSLLAQFIHMNSPRRGCPFIRVDCGAIARQLIDSELFGHERGAFTGAVEQRIGHFEEANGGTIFLDEIGELPIELQPKLLHVIETGMFRRVGGNKELNTDIRIIASTNADMTSLIDQGLFRKDLYFRLNVISITLPPLHHHPEDIVPYAELFLRGKRKHLTPSAQRVLMNYGWPGNFRELRNVLDYATIMAHGNSILPAHFPDYIQPTETPDHQGSVLIGNMHEIERRAIIEALEKTGGNKSSAAKLLGISRSAFSYKLRDYLIK